MLEDTTPARAFQISNKHLGLVTNLGRMAMFLNWLKFPAGMFKKQSHWSLCTSSLAYFVLAMD